MASNEKLPKKANDAIQGAFNRGAGAPKGNGGKPSPGKSGTKDSGKKK